MFFEQEYIWCEKKLCWKSWRICGRRLLIATTRQRGACCVTGILTSPSMTTSLSCIVFVLTHTYGDLIFVSLYPCTRIYDHFFIAILLSSSVLNAQCYLFNLFLTLQSGQLYLYHRQCYYHLSPDSGTLNFIVSIVELTLYSIVL